MQHAVACGQRDKGKERRPIIRVQGVIELPSVPTSSGSMWETALILAVIVALIFAFGAIRLD